MSGFLSALRAVCRAIFIFPWGLCGDCEGDDFCEQCGMALRFF